LGPNVDLNAFITVFFHVGVIRNGGAQPNIIPEETELEYYLRTPTDAEMSDLKSKVEGCVKAAALATGCTVCVHVIVTFIQCTTAHRCLNK